jgi:hypothetical protein
MARFSSVHEPMAQSGSAQHQRTLCRTIRAERPKEAKSASSTAERSFTRAMTRQVGQPTGASPRDSMWMNNGWPERPKMPRTLTLGKPTSNSHMRIGFVSTEALQDRLA